MKAKIVSIDEIDRRNSRPAAEAEGELCECLTDLSACLEDFARTFPGCIALGGFAAGESFGILVIAPSIRGHYRSLQARQAVEELAVIIANLPGDLRAIFEQEFAKEKARRQKLDLRLASGEGGGAAAR